MSNKNTQFGGTDWVNGEVLYAADLNDTFSSVKTYKTTIQTLSLAPVGSIVGWDDNTTPPEGWVSCNGGTITDAESPMNGEVIPNLNGTDNTTSLFLRGNSTSGTTGGSVSHNHPFTGSQYYEGITNSNRRSYANGANHIPKYYEIQWILRIK